MTTLDRHPLIRMLRALDLPADQYVVCGSGPLLAHGLRDIGDLDVVATGQAWRTLAGVRRPVAAPSGHGHIVRLEIEVADRWLPGWHTADLLHAAEVHAGVPFAPLATVAAWKQAAGRPKDLLDVALIDAALTRI